MTQDNDATPTLHEVALGAFRVARLVCHELELLSYMSILDPPGILP